MNTFEKNTIAPDARDFLGGNYLNKEDLRGVTVVTVIDVQSVAFPRSPRRKLVALFHELQKPLILNKTNTRLMAGIFGTTDTSLWRGKVELYVEPNVEYSGRVVGGIRVQPHTVFANEVDNLMQIPIANGHRDAELDLEGMVHHS